MRSSLHLQVFKLSQWRWENESCFLGYYRFSLSSLQELFRELSNWLTVALSYERKVTCAEEVCCATKLYWTAWMKVGLKLYIFFLLVQNSSLEISRIMYWFSASVMKVGDGRPYDVTGRCIFSLVRTNWGTKMCHKLEIPCYLCIRISLTHVKCRPNVERTSETYTKSYFRKFSLRRRTGYYRREDVFRISLDIVGVAVERWRQ